MTSTAIIDSAIALHAHQLSRGILSKFRDQYVEMQQLVKELTAANHHPPVNWNLTQSETIIVRLLAVHKDVTADGIMHVLYSKQPDTERHADTLRVFMCKIRKKLRPFNISIDTVWGRGFCVDEENWQKLREGFGMEDQPQHSVRQEKHSVRQENCDE